MIAENNMHRTHLAFALLAFFSCANAHAFGFKDVDARAQQRASASYKPPEANVPDTSTGVVVFAPDNSNSMQSIAPVPVTVDVNVGTASPPAATFVQIATRTFEVLKFGTSKAFTQPEAVAVAVTDVDAPHVTTATRRCPATRNCDVPHVPVTEPATACVLTGTPTL